MRILEIIDLAYEAGGAEKSVKLIKEEMTKKGHVVKVLATDRNLHGKISFADYIIPSLNDKGFRKFYVHVWSSKQRSEVQAIVDSFKPNVVHLHTIGGFSPSVLRAVASVPSVLTVHGPEGFTRKLLRWQLLASDFRHRSYKWKDVKISGLLRYLYYACTVRPLFVMGRKNLKVLIAPSQFMADVIKSDAGTVPIVQLYNGIELAESKVLPKNKSILYVGRLEAVKGVADLIRSFANIVKRTSAQLVIVGDGVEADELKSLAKSLRCEKYIYFAGWVPADKVSEYYAKSLIVAIPSIWPENLPTVAIEALAIGRPIIGAKVGGIPELIEENKNGLLVSSGDVDALTNALLKMLTMPSQELTQYQQNSLKTARRFDINTFIGKLELIYEKVVKDNKSI